MRAVHVLVSGRVQGVCFRASTRDQATRLGVRGWVRNLEDGRVEGHFEGEAAAVDELVRWCHEGPPSARVEHVVVEAAEAAGHDAFEVRR